MGLFAHAEHAVGQRSGDKRWSRRAKVTSSIVGAVLAGAAAFAASNWVVGLNSGSSGEGQSAGVGNLTILAVATPSPTNLLYPGGTGDVVVTITNPNPYPVTVTAVQLPADTAYATGYTSSSLTTVQSGCDSTDSAVTWSGSTSSSGTSYTLAAPLTVAADGQSGDPLTVTFTGDAAMATSAPAACVDTYFSMPSFTGVTATGGAATATASPATDSWTG